MANMSYCRFHNTLSDLRDCWDNMDDDLSEEERKARERLIALCKRIADNYCDEDEDT
jgi:hypothetical protein